MKTFRCDGCGANIEIESDAVNTKCEYCNTVVRIHTPEEYDAKTIVGQIAEIVKLNQANDKFENKYKRAIHLIERNEYRHANDVLNEILHDDPAESRAWFYKSLLPILEQESVLYCGCYINLTVYKSLTKNDAITEYLNQCGLPKYKHSRFRRFYGSADLLYEQQMKFIDKAIENAIPTRAEFFKAEKEKIIERQKRKEKRKTAANIGLLCGFVGVIVIALLFSSGLVFRWIGL